MKRIFISLILVFLLMVPVYAIEVAGEESVQIGAPSAVLMEKSSGELIYEKNGNDRGSPASVTKVMTLLLVMEEIEAGRMSEDDLVTCSAYAASMGGSQIWLEEGETMTVGDMLKAVTVVSANDCTVALAEHISGSETSFVTKMNARAMDLGMVDTNFTDCTGLTDDENHYTTAFDIALMSRMLIRHDEIKKYTTIWMDTLRGGASELTNTNKLVRFYPDATGLKTGFTQRAMYCISATAERDGTEYIAVIMHAETSTDRFESAKALLNFGFANYMVCPLRSGEALPPIRVNLGTADSVQPVYGGREGMLLEKSNAAQLRYETDLPETLEAPIDEGQEIGQMRVYSNETQIAVVPLLAGSAIEKLTLFNVYENLVLRLFGG